MTDHFGPEVDLDELTTWGIRHGYAMCRCPDCGSPALASVFTAVTEQGTPKADSGGWPFCRACSTVPRQGLVPSHGPRVVPVVDITDIRRLKPGEPRTAKQLSEDGCIVRADDTLGNPQSPPVLDLPSTDTVPGS